MRPPHGAYIPPLRFHFLTRFYDGLVRWTAREATFKEALLGQVGQAPSERLLDVGCGTATLTIELTRRFPQAQVMGLDADAAALGIARAKAADTGANLNLEQAFADRMPFRAESFDAAVSSLFFHHLTADKKRRVLGELLRVLRPGGRLHVADWGRPTNFALRAAFFLVQALDGFETTRDSVAGVLPEMIFHAGFVDVRHTGNFATALGTMALYCATKPR
jgi:ubiquinone/menaquinone biosynthesis C-methylase UbiE